MRASYRTSCQPLRLRDRVAVCCGALLKLYDRCTTPSDWIMSNTIFSGGDDCWTGACKNLQQWVDNHGGRASIPGSISARHDWDTIKAAYWQDPPI